jgi:asparagine synthase (glutamine-hydrolysing)
MCGIAGILSSRPVAAVALAAMADRLHHRGPDDEGVWIDDSGQVGFGHRRLAIIDLSPAGHQPMASADGRYILSYNGEIYNHAEIRREIDGQFGKQPWRGHSDTETLLEAIARWGLEAALNRCVGMFALSLWDRKERMLHLARDRFGEKPLFYGWVGEDFAFASELPAIQLHPRFDNRIDRNALGLFAARNYVPTPLSIYERIYKLQPGCILSVSPDVAAYAQSEPPQPGFASAHLKLERYWSYRETIMDGLDEPIENEELALEELEAALSQSVMGQSLADVPVGAFLSGGIDSSTIVALYQKYSSKPVRTYTIGFEDRTYDEAPAAREVARHLGTQHHELYVTSRDAQDVIPKLASIYGEPFADSSQIPTCLISAFAREEVKVALSGDGGDELFGGYNRYLGLASAWQRLERLRPSVRAMAGGALGTIPPRFWDVIARAAGHRTQPHFGGKIQKSFKVMGQAEGTDDLVGGFTDEWWQEGSPVLGAVDCDDLESEARLSSDLPAPMRMMYRDAISYLPDDILCKVDRASMGVSLESRVPYLDHRVAAVAARIPLGLKLRGGHGKHILRQLLFREAPRHLFERPKSGFAIPVGEWIKGPLRAWAEELIEPARMTEEGWFDAKIIQRRWQDHVGGRRESSAALWAILMFQAWLREQKQPVALAA